MATGFSQWGNDLHTGRRSYDIVGKRRRWYIASGVLIVLSILAMLVRPFNLGIEFKGGAEFVVANVAELDQSRAIDVVADAGITETARISTVGTTSMRVQTVPIEDEVTLAAVKDGLAQAYEVTAADVTVSQVGPTWGQDVLRKALQGLGVFLVLVAIVMTIYFRNWRMAAAALIALLHDLVVTVGVYAAIGWEVTPATMIGFLTILGYSIYDTVVVFDKVRENTDGILAQKRATYAERANLAVNQTLVRSINTSVVALLPVSSILFIGAFVLGAGTLRDIALALFVGMAVGAYSSIYLATPLEVTLREREDTIKTHTAKVIAGRTAKGDEAGESTPAHAHTGQLAAGHHLGTAAQPKKKRRRK
ncbi:protein translocase subunit secF [Flavimobilis soli]|uniref:Protein-export membrane protein SecF n=1 Tax=Flavimobilis soli TaxID=442709 RepID=A0A2A9EBS8_9MICO|nr:protein translocase subunit SecF [Flavimobilis soli]PFG35669.1 protein translocase subunit secF [Flavimobilis soli]